MWQREEGYYKVKRGRGVVARQVEAEKAVGGMARLHNARQVNG